MSSGRNKYQSRENRQRVRKALNQHWDPIGVVSNPDLDDEYDGYASTVYVMLMDHSMSEAAISEYLYQTATAHIGLTPYEGLAEKCGKTAAILVGLRPQFETH